MKLGESVEQEIRQFAHNIDLYHRCFYSTYSSGMRNYITKEIHNEIDEALWDFINDGLPTDDFDTLYNDNHEDEEDYDEEDEDW